MSGSQPSMLWLEAYSGLMSRTNAGCYVCNQHYLSEATSLALRQNQWSSPRASSVSRQLVFGCHLLNYP